MFESKTNSSNHPWDVPTFTGSPEKLKPNPTPNFKFTYRDLSLHYQENSKDNSKNLTRTTSLNKNLLSQPSSQVSPIASKQAFNDEENIEFDSTEEHIQPILNGNSEIQNTKEGICCPFCQKRIDFTLGKLIQSLQSPSFSELAGEIQLSERLKTPFSPMRIGLIQGKGQENKSLHDLNLELYLDSPVIKPMEIPEGIEEKEISGFLYEVKRYNE